MTTKDTQRKRKKKKKDQQKPVPEKTGTHSVCICMRKNRRKRGRQQNGAQNQSDRKQRVRKSERGRNPFLYSALHLFALNHAKDMEALCSRAEGISIIRLEKQKRWRGPRKRRKNDETRRLYFWQLLVPPKEEVPAKKWGAAKWARNMLHYGCIIRSDKKATK